MYLVLDESGTHRCRYLVLGGYSIDKPSRVSHVIRKTNTWIWKHYPKYKGQTEIKPDPEDIDVKKRYLDRLSNVINLKVHYIVADKGWIRPDLLDDENCLINYLLSLLIEPIAKQCVPEELNIWLDNRSIRTRSINSFADYIKIKVRYEWNLAMQVNVKYLCSENAYAIQAAHHIVNAIWHRFELNQRDLYQPISGLAVHHIRFPKARFGMPKTGRLQSQAGTL